MPTDLPVPSTALTFIRYPATADRRLLDLLPDGPLDISPIRPRVYTLAALPEAMEAAATAGNLERVMVQPAALP
jgi:alcohol dehydrogenase